MKARAVSSNYAATIEQGQSSAEILILPDGRILAHNITPAVAAVLAELDPSDEAMRLRAAPPAIIHHPSVITHPIPTSPVLRSALLPRP